MKLDSATVVSLTVSRVTKWGFLQLQVLENRDSGVGQECMGDTTYRMPIRSMSFHVHGRICKYAQRCTTVHLHIGTKIIAWDRFWMRRYIYKVKCVLV